MIDGIAHRAAPLACVVRSGVVESVHHGHVVGLAGGGTAAVVVGDPDVTFFPRSSLKPLQAVAMLRAGLDLSGELLALAAASHSGEADHLDGVRRILAGAELVEGDLQNTPDLPLDPDAAARWRAAGRRPTPLAQNCSGKHAAMLATCRAAGWDIAGYRDPGHPLQRAIRDDGGRADRRPGRAHRGRRLRRTAVLHDARRSGPRRRPYRDRAARPARGPGRRRDACASRGGSRAPAVTSSGSPPRCPG